MAGSASLVDQWADPHLEEAAPPHPAWAALARAAMPALFLRDDGLIVWSNAAASNLAPEMRDGSSTLEDLAEPHERTVVARLLRAASMHGTAEGIVQLSSACLGGSRHLHLLISRSDDWAEASSGAGPSRLGVPGAPADLLEPGLIVQAWDVSALVMQIHDLESHSFRDPVTGLSNRLGLDARLDQEIARSGRTGCHIATLFVDIEGLNRLQAQRGDSDTNVVLREVGQRLQCNLRPGDTLASVGAGEFVVLCPDLTRREQAQVVADRLLAAATVSIPEEGRQLGLAVTVSIAFPDDTAAQLSRPGHGPSAIPIARSGRPAGRAVTGIDRRGTDRSGTGPKGTAPDGTAPDGTGPDGTGPDGRDAS